MRKFDDSLESIIKTVQKLPKENREAALIGCFMEGAKRNFDDHNVPHEYGQVICSVIIGFTTLFYKYKEMEDK